MQKLLVMSATYRQSSRVTPDVLKRDPQNRLLARGPRFRLDAEMLRDQALFTSGLLVEEIGGLRGPNLVATADFDSNGDVDLIVTESFADTVTTLVADGRGSFTTGPTSVVGQASSMAAVLLAAGAEGKRSVLPNRRVLIHQPLLYGLQGQQTDIDIHAKDLLRMRNRIEEIFVLHTGKSKEEIHNDTERDKILTADESVDYGLADQVMGRRES